MTIAVDWDIKHQTKPKTKHITLVNHLYTGNGNLTGTPANSEDPDEMPLGRGVEIVKFSTCQGTSKWP